MQQLEFPTADNQLQAEHVLHFLWLKFAEWTSQGLPFSMQALPDSVQLPLQDTGQEGDPDIFQQ